MITVLYCTHRKIKQKLKTDICRLTTAVICRFCDKKRNGEFHNKEEEGKKAAASRLAWCFYAGFLLGPSVLHTAQQAPTANIPQTKINTVSL